MKRYLSVKRIGQIALKLLNDYNISGPWVDVEKLAVEHLGLRIEWGSFGENVCGLLINKGGQSIIGLNSDLKKGNYENRIRFTIAHEIGHYILGHQRDGVFVDQKTEHFSVFLRDEKSSEGTNQQEIEANAFAAALLMPEPFLRTVIERMIHSGQKFDLSSDNDDIIPELAKEFGVSKMAMTYRIGNLNLFNTV